MKVKCDDRQIELTDDFIQSIKNMMTAEINMFRLLEPDYKECWAVGKCEIVDLMDINGLRFSFSELDDMEYFLKDALIFVVVPF